MASTTDASALSAQPTADDAGWGLSGARRITAIAAVLAGMVLVVLDAAILNVALPSIARALHATAAMSVRSWGKAAAIGEFSLSGWLCSRAPPRFAPWRHRCPG